jgi:hypothetical protein
MLAQDVPSTATNFRPAAGGNTLCERKQTKAGERPNSANIQIANEGEGTIRFRPSMVAERYKKLRVYCGQEIIKSVCRSLLISHTIFSFRHFHLFYVCTLYFTFCYGIVKLHCRNYNIRIERKKMFMGTKKLIL